MDLRQMEKGGIVCSMERIMAIYDVDQSYASRFADFVNQREKLPFTAVSFTSLEKLKEYAKSHSIEILLVSDEVRREVEDIEAGQVVALCDGEIVEMEEDWPAVYKYQSASPILHRSAAVRGAGIKKHHSVQHALVKGGKGRHGHSQGHQKHQRSAAFYV